MGGGGGRINKPKTASCRTDARKQTRSKVKAQKKSHVRSAETLDTTTEDQLRQCRTNPKANVKLSGKKKRLLRKEAKRLLAEKTQMEVTDEKTVKTAAPVQKTGMDTT